MSSEDRIENVTLQNLYSYVMVIGLRILAWHVIGMFEYRINLAGPGSLSVTKISVRDACNHNERNWSTSTVSSSELHHAELHCGIEQVLLYGQQRTLTKKVKYSTTRHTKKTRRLISSKFACVIMSWTTPDMKNYIAVESRVSEPHICDFSFRLRHKFWTHFRFLQLPTDQTNTAFGVTCIRIRLSEQERTFWSVFILGRL